MSPIQFNRYADVWFFTFAKMTRSWVGLVTTLLIAVWLPTPAHAADMYLSPANTTIITGCVSNIPIRINTKGNQTNGAQLYLEHDGQPGEVQLLSTGGVFDVYRVPDINPTSYLALRGYGGYLSGEDIQFARVQLLSTRVGETISLGIVYDAEADYTSRVAHDGIDITDAVFGGTYTVVSGFCDTVPPQISNIVPEHNTPNHPIDGMIAFDATDTSSGIDIDTLEITVTHAGFTGSPIVYTSADPEVTVTPLNARDYAVTVNPEQQFAPQTVVQVQVRVADQAGNIGTRTWSFNGLTCEQLGCSGGDPDVPIVTHQCNDGIDNDGNGLVDLDDPSCRTESESTIVETIVTVVTTSTEVIVEYRTSTVPVTDPDGGDPPAPGALFQPSDLRYFLANRTVQVLASPARVVTGLVQNPLGIDLSLASATDVLIQSAVLHTSFADPIPMVFDNTTGRYRVDVTLPATPGFSDAFVRVTYGDDVVESLPFRINSLPYGQVLRTVGQDTEPAAGATVTLEAYIDGAYVTIDNRAVVSGQYAFIVPNGVYRLTASLDGHHINTTARFGVQNNIVNRTITLRSQISLLDPEVPLDEKVAHTVATVREQIDVIRDTVNDPIVERQVQQTVAPAAAAVTAAAVLPALSALGFLNYLRFLFLQPLLLFGRRTRKRWGYVYDTLTRNPIDLAQVRLIDTKTNRVMQSRVTDAQGRYMFFADPGTYRIEVDKPSFVFPSQLLIGEREDGPYLDIYHGEPILVTEENTAIVANVPIDPVTAEERPKRIVREKIWRNVRSGVSMFGVVAGILAVIVSPGVLTIGLMLLQVIVLALFYRLAKPKKPKDWGIVYDAADKRRLPKVVVRLFSKRFDKLVSTDYTDAKGRYAFLVNPNEYYIMFQKSGYEHARKDVAIAKASDVVSESVGLVKEQDDKSTKE